MSECPKAKESPRRVHGEAKEPHTCPYAAEICDDHDTLCSCCDECEGECAMDNNGLAHSACVVWRVVR